MPPPSERQLRAAWLLLPALLQGGGATGSAPAEYPDPAPPVVHALEPLAAPAAEAYPGLRFHRAPRALSPDAAVQDWPSFLGPERDGRSRETGLARTWPEAGPPLVWEMTRGDGFASPVVAEGRLVFTHRTGDVAHVDCLDAETGKRFWRFSYPSGYRGRYIANNGPRSTPAIAQGRVYVHGVEGMLHCLELSTGRVVWKRDLQAELGVGDDFFGTVSSPLVVGELLIQNVGAPGGPSVAAFDRSTGRIAWGTGTEWGPSCASPVLAEAHGVARLLVMAGGESRPPTGGLMVLDPLTGALDFTYAFRSRTYESANGASPIVDAGRVFLTASYGVGSAALALQPGGGYRELWRHERLGVQFSNPVFHEGRVYVIDGVSGRAGAIVCIDPATGAELARTDLAWDETVVDGGVEKRLSSSIGEGSLLWADGAFLCLGDSGHLLRLELSPGGARVLARAALFHAGESWTPLVLSHGLLYVCQNTRERFGDAPPRLLCYDLRGGDGAARDAR